MISDQFYQMSFSLKISLTQFQQCSLDSLNAAAFLYLAVMDAAPTDPRFTWDTKKSL